MARESRGPLGKYIPRPDRNQFQRFNNIPVIGDWLGRVGRVLQIASNPCAPTPTIWITAFFAGIPTMMWFFAKPSPTDYLAERLGSGRKKKKWKITVQATEALGRAGGGGALMTKAFTALRAAGYYFTVADMLTAGAVNWVSTAYRWSGCTTQGQNSAWAFATAIPDSVELPGPGSSIFTFWENGTGHLMVAGAGGVAVPGGMIGSVGYSLTADQYHPDFPIPSWTAELISNLGDTVAESPTITEQSGKQSSTGFFYNGMGLSRIANKTHTNGTYQVRITKDAGLMKWTSGSIQGTATPLSDAVTPDP